MFLAVGYGERDRDKERQLAQPMEMRLPHRHAVAVIAPVDEATLASELM